MDYNLENSGREGFGSFDSENLNLSYTSHILLISKNFGRIESQPIKIIIKAERYIITFTFKLSSFNIR